MVVYIGPEAAAPAAHHIRRVRTCTVAADTAAELYSFARRAGLSRPRIRAAIKNGHYDIPAGRRAAAIRMGAVEISGERLTELANRPAGFWSTLAADNAPDPFEPASGPDADGMIHQLVPIRRDRDKKLFALCGITVTEKLPYYAHTDCPTCAEALAVLGASTDPFSDCTESEHQTEPHARSSLARCLDARQRLRKRSPAMSGHDTSDAFTLTVTDRLDVLRPDGSTWDPCEGHDHGDRTRTMAQVLNCLVWECLVSTPPAYLNGPRAEPLRIILPGAEPFVAVFHGADEEFPTGRTLDETGLPLCWRTVAEAVGASAAETAESIVCPSCEHPPPRPSWRWTGSVPLPRTRRDPH